MSSVRWTPGCAVQQHVSGCERSVCERHTACVVLCNSIHYSTAVNTIAQLERICFSSARAVNCQIKGFGSQSIPGGRALVQPMDPTRFVGVAHWFQYRARRSLTFHHASLQHIRRTAFIATCSAVTKPSPTLTARAAIASRAAARATVEPSHTSGQ